MYISQLFNSFVKRLLGNGKWYHCACVRIDTTSFQTSVTIFTRVSSKLLKQLMNGKILVYLKNRALQESKVVFLEIGRIIMQFRPQNVILWNRRNGFKNDWAKAACLQMKYFLWTDFIVTLIHCVTYKDASHFWKPQHIRTFRVNCNTSLTDVLVKPLPVQKSICLLIRPFNYSENIGNII